MVKIFVRWFLPPFFGLSIGTYIAELNKAFFIGQYLI
tara:strand:+ start:1094 stop:1204 length:111 start_codon:yes stop_codon:yes gene_type:complete